ncbi:gfo/Idh/MocA family oxidoreductase [Phyllobacterium salinisoli]|uniref:Gfo/Idh/MocA family oxidoreductase n=1 Tax=Phyllobacterium salinisoli TaxID=1899321 RepID=A0A368K8L8_9HYPH|nr:Gfo/Idh/MocA family oxidoreductase [Phyllobacterium salinisoli]RCS25706.1 gfo/Idh/MocA family oxidoreductase [Phyllobacterium salinisoli]
MKIAILGTGFVADYYMTTLPNHPSLQLAGVYDRDPERLKQFCAFYDVRAYAGLDEVLADPDIAIVVNLTTPENHYEISKRTLEAGKHVYCEKPLAMRFEEAQDLVALASRRRLTLCAAPANALSDANRLVRKALSDRAIGTPRLVYAQMEDGPVFRGKWETWRSRSGARWPGLHELEIGCTLEHSGYALSWLVSLFGPATSLTAFSAVTFPDKGPGTEGIVMAPDFSVGCIQFRSGVVARLTCGLAAPRDRSLTVLGDGGSLTVRDLWDNRSAVHLERLTEGKQLKMRVADWLEDKVKRALPWKPTPGRRLSYKGLRAEAALPAFPSRIDFAAGIAAQARAIGSGIPAFFSGDVALHVTELALALNNAHDLPQPYVLRSSFTQPAQLPA